LHDSVLEALGAKVARSIDAEPGVTDDVLVVFDAPVEPGGFSYSSSIFDSLPTVRRSASICFADTDSMVSPLAILIRQRSMNPTTWFVRAFAFRWAVNAFCRGKKQAHLITVKYIRRLVFAV
jgi:hypothetical protein